jgi:hypothetical protein
MECHFDLSEIDQMKTILLVVMASMLGGCYFGPGGVCAPGIPVIYCSSKEERDQLLHPKPYIDYWEKTDADATQRRVDTKTCGAVAPDYFPGFGTNQINASRRENESNEQVEKRLFYN